jgi:hypothetical protein
VKAAADAAERRSKGIAETEPKVPIDPPVSHETYKPSIVLPKIGRPTKYREEFCGRVIELGAQGKSKAQMAATLGIARENFDDWEKRHERFRHAVKCACNLSLAWWEDRGQRGMGEGKEFNAVAFIFQMKNRFRDDYSDRSEVAHKLDASQAFLQMVQHISGQARPKAIEGKP